MNSKKKKSYTNTEDQQCSLLDIPIRQLDDSIDIDRAFLIRNNEFKWVNNTVIHYYFFNSPAKWRGSQTQQNEVIKAFSKWKKLGIGLEFVEVDKPAAAEIRIGFEIGGSWSTIGRQAIDVGLPISRRTMNFGWDLSTKYGNDTALHEIGHALCFHHEHQNPNAGIEWDKEAVYEYYKGAPNFWDRNKTFRNILRKISPSDVGGTDWDKDSIMHYKVKAGLIISPEEYQNKALIPSSGLSSSDISEVMKFYPDTSKTTIPELKPFLSKVLKLAAGQQVDYIIQPDISRKYTIQTFGQMDTVMVIFEDDNGEPIYISGDDDSGFETNSKIELRLISGRTYYLRLRLYYAIGFGQGSIMLW